MKDVEASALLVRLEASWPNPRWTETVIEDWREDLMPLDAGHCGTAYARLRQRLTHRPTFAEFKTEYAALSRFDGSKKIFCDHCDSTGWVGSGPIRDHAPTCDPIIGCRCPGLVPCGCELGDGPRNIHAKYLGEVAKERTRNHEHRSRNLL